MFTRTLCISIFTLSLLVSPVWSAMGEHAGWTSDLNLTIEQKAKLVKIHNEMSDIRTKHRENIASVRLRLKNELNLPNPSKQNLDGYAVELGKLHTLQIQNNTEQMLKIKAILTPEQFSKLIDKRLTGQRKGAHGQFKGMRGNSADCVDNPGNQDNAE